MHVAYYCIVFISDCGFCKVAPSHPSVTTAAKMSSGTVIGTSLPKIAPASTPIHMAQLPSSPSKATRSPTKLIDTTNLRNKSAPAVISSKTLVTSSDYGSHIQYRNNSYDVYPPFVGERQTGVRVPPRVNPLCPPPPQRLTTSLETIEPHWHNEKRRNTMQQREWYRYHGTWSKAFYGSPAEKEAYKWGRLFSGDKSYIGCRC